MTIHSHQLAGCSPRPLSSYLKALGVLRIVALQADPEARGRWTHESFVLETSLGRADLMDFFLWRWKPNPFLSPWNKGSGLLGEDKKGVEPLEKSVAPRFEPIRHGIATTRTLTREMEEAVADEKELKGRKTKLKDRAAKAALDADPAYKAELRSAAKRCKRLKDNLQPECQRRFRGPALAWIRAALVLSADGQATFPALLGTGGNDGKLDFTNNAMQRLGNLFELASKDGAPRPEALPALVSTLFGDIERSIVSGAIGQYAPSNAGGPNGTSGPLGSSGLNPWDLPLLLEGALFFAASASRRLGAAANDRVVAPFSTRSLASGYGSASLSDENARGEQWFPLWSRPATAGELEALLIEGRSQLGTRPADNSLDMARSIARLGIARGITAFERYGYIERNGKSNYAVPLGRWEVRAEPRGTLLDDLEAGDWWSRLRRACRGEHAPQSLVALERRLSDTALEALARDGDSGRWQDVLLTLATLEAQLVDSGTFTARERIQPIPPLGPGWLDAIDDRSPEVRLALALATSGEAHDRNGSALDSIRHHFLPVNRFGRFEIREKALAHDPRVVMTGRDPIQDLAGLVMRRVIEARTAGSRRRDPVLAGLLPLEALTGFEAQAKDLALVVAGGVDLTRTVWLARALSPLEPHRLLERGPLRHGPDDLSELDPVWGALRLSHLVAPLSDGRRFTLDPAIVRTLTAGDLSRAFELARVRLSGGGLRLPLRGAIGDGATAHRIAASLAFPISRKLSDRIARELDPQSARRAQEMTHVR